MINKNFRYNVNIILPTYNRAQLIARAIKSLLNQTYQDFEIIVVDDGSTDNTEEVVKKIDDKRIRYIRHKENKGAATARNTGIKAAKAQYIAFQDSDDEWLLEKIEKQIIAFKNVSPKVGVVYTGFWKIQDNKKIYMHSFNIKSKEGDIHESLLKGNFIATPATLIKKECFERIGMFDEKLPTLEDWELWIRISKYYHFKYIDEPLLISYYSLGGVNEPNLPIKAKALKLILKKHFNDIKKDRKVLAGHYFYIGHVLCLSGKIVQGRNYFVKAIIIYPLDVKFFLLIIISLFGKRAYAKIRKFYRRFLSRCLKV
jgi:glycosyltransferase involved in cell wall biosynthesis